MKRISKLVSPLVVGFLVALAVLTGIFTPLDRAMQSLRFSQASHAATGQFVFVDINAKSLTEIGTWPWPRSNYARAIKNLIEWDAANIALDIDFSARSNTVDDAIFAEALEEAGGFVMLAAFAQNAATAEDQYYNFPLPEFRQNADPVVVNVQADPDGVVRTYSFGGVLDGAQYPSLAQALVGVRPDLSEFHIDFSIDATTVAYASMVDVINGTANPDIFAGKNVVIGAGALELRDIFAVPRYGVLPGPMVQILAAETIAQGTQKHDVGNWPQLVLIALLAAAFWLVRRARKFPVQLAWVVLVAVTVEILAFIGQAQTGLLFGTSSIHFAQIGMIFTALLSDVDLQRILLRRTRQERDTTQGMLDRVIADNFDGVVVVGANARILALSKFAATFFGIPNDGRSHLNAIGKLPDSIVSEIVDQLTEGAEGLEGTRKELMIAAGPASGRVIEYVISFSDPQADESEADEGKSRVVCLTFRDVTDRRRQEMELAYLASHDRLTGALSRPELLRVIEEWRTRDPCSDVMLFLIDLNRFKAINDTLGHSNGDALLRQAKSRLQGLKIGPVARVGGDSFAVAVHRLMPADEAVETAAKISETLSEIYLIGEHRGIVGARVGIVDTRTAGDDIEGLFSKADMALSKSKRGIGTVCAIYEPEMDRRLHGRQDMEIALRYGIANDELKVVFQPQADLKTGRIIGAEALVRWNSATLGEVSPGAFIPLAEETGLILDLGRFIMIDACKQALEWGDDISIAVNVSPMQFEFGDVNEIVREALSSSGLPPHRLELEITEGVYLANTSEVSELLETLRSLGIRVAIDDFGTGYSSLSYLGDLPIDKIKIDQGFVRSVNDTPSAAAIISSIVTLASAMDKSVLAEGVETAEQNEKLIQLGCTSGQGFYFGRPGSSQDILDLIAANGKAGLNSDPGDRLAAAI